MSWPFDPFSRTPMYAGQLGEYYTGPFNFNMGNIFGSQLGPIMQLAGPMLAQSLMGPGQQPLQFLPTQNVHDQMMASRFFQGQFRSAERGAERDIDSMRKTMGGMMRMIQGRELTDQEQQQTYTMAKDLSGLLPTAEAILGPEMIDSLMGSKGSGAVMQRQMYKAMYHGLDPVTGAIGVHPERAANIGEHVFERLYGENSDPSKVRGIKAGSMGALYTELTQRGMMGEQIGAQPTLAGRYAAAAKALPAELDTGTLERIARSSQPGQELLRRTQERTELQEEVSKLRKIKDTDITNEERTRLHETERRLSRTREVTDEDWGQVTSEVRSKHRGLRQKVQEGKGLSPQDLAGLDASGIGEGLIQAGQADRIAQRLKSLTGTVNAMRDIFGDMGRPNAPMRELLNGLEALTQGSMANMNPAAVESLVRTNYNLAKQSGLGMQGMLGLAGQAAGRADQLGLERGLVPYVMQGTMAYGAAANQVGGAWNIPSWGRLNAEQLTLQDQNLRLQGLASQTANIGAGMRRMKAMGFLQKGSEAEAIVEAIDRKETTYVDPKTGERKEIGFQTDERGMRRQRGYQDWMKLAQDAGVDHAVAREMFADKFANQEFMRDGMDDWIRKMQPEMDWKPLMENWARDQTRMGMMAQGGSLGRGSAFGKAAAAAGIDVNRASINTARNFVEAAWEINRPENREIRDDRESRLEFLSGKMRKAMEQDFTAQIRESNPALSEEEAQAKAKQVVDQISPDQMRQRAAQWQSAVGARARQMGIGNSDLQVFQKGDATTMEVAARQRDQAERTGQIQSAMSGIGRSGPVERLIDAMKDFDPKKDSLKDVLVKTMGAKSVGQLAETDPVMKWYAAQVQEAATIDRSTPEGQKNFDFRVRQIRAASFGGTEAVQEIERLKAEKKTLEAQPESPQRDEQLKRIDQAIQMQSEVVRGTPAHLDFLKQREQELTTAVDRHAPAARLKGVGQAAQAEVRRLEEQRKTLLGQPDTPERAEQLKQVDAEIQRQQEIVGATTKMTGGGGEPPSQAVQLQRARATAEQTVKRLQTEEQALSKQPESEQRNRQLAQVREAITQQTAVAKGTTQGPPAEQLKHARQAARQEVQRLEAQQKELEQMSPSPERDEKLKQVKAAIQQQQDVLSTEAEAPLSLLQAQRERLAAAVGKDSTPIAELRERRARLASEIERAEGPKVGTPEERAKLAQDLVAAFDASKGKQDSGWNSAMGNFQTAQLADGTRVFRDELGNTYRRAPGSRGARDLWQRYDERTGGWGRTTGITEYRRKKAGLEPKVKPITPEEEAEERKMSPEAVAKKRQQLATLDQQLQAREALDETDRYIGSRKKLEEVRQAQAGSSGKGGSVGDRIEGAGGQVGTKDRKAALLELGRMYARYNPQDKEKLRLYDSELGGRRSVALDDKTVAAMSEEQLEKAVREGKSAFESSGQKLSAKDERRRQELADQTVDRRIDQVVSGTDPGSATKASRASSQSREPVEMRLKDGVVRIDGNDPSKGFLSGIFSAFMGSSNPENADVNIQSAEGPIQK